MKANNWLKEIPLVAIMLAPFLVCLYLKPLLPPLLPSHYTIGSDGKWVVNAYMSPMGLVSSMFLGCLITYVSLTIPMYLTKWQQLPQKQSALLAPIFFILKGGLILLLSGIPVYEMLEGAGKISGSSASVLSYTVGVVLLVLLNLFIYRLYTVMYKFSEDKPLTRQYYVIIWASTHVVISIGPICALLAAGSFNAERMIPQFILVFLAICGNLLYNVRPNLYLGIRTPWTLKNETVWRKTHRLGGVLLFIFGTLGFIATLVAGNGQANMIMIAVLLISTMIPVIYSYVIYKKIIHQS